MLKKQKKQKYNKNETKKKKRNNKKNLKKKPPCSGVYNIKIMKNNNDQITYQYHLVYSL